MTGIFRGERWEVSYGIETTYGTDPGTALLTQMFGVFDKATLGDPELEFEPHWGLTDTAGRTFAVAYRGKWKMAAGIGDILMLNGSHLWLPFGSYDTAGTDDTTVTPGASTLDGATIAGATSITLVDATGYANGEYIQIGTASDAHWEVREILSIAGAPTVTLTKPLWFAHVTGVTCNQVKAPYTHTISETNELMGLTMHATYWDAGGENVLMRRYHGGKVGRATLTAEEGNMLRYSIDEIVFKDISHDIETSTKYAAGVAQPTISFPETEPYYFNYGSLSINGTTFARCKNFRLEIGNNCEPRYYIATNASDRVPYEIREGRREYTLSTAIDVSDTSLYEEILAEGVDGGALTGFQVIMTFTRGTSDTITITLPPSAPAFSLHGQGCFIKKGKLDIVSEPVITQELDILARSAQIVVVDSIPDYP